MWFDAVAYLVELETGGGSPANPANPANPPGHDVPISENSEISRGWMPRDSAATGPGGQLWPSHDRRWRAHLSGLAATEVVPAFTGKRKTWCGRLVTQEEWLNLSDWDRHGSTGKLWDGVSGQWENADPL